MSHFSHDKFHSYFQQFYFLFINKLTVECVSFIDIMLSFCILILDESAPAFMRLFMLKWMQLLLVIEYKPVRSSFVNVSIHSNVVECFPPYSVVWQLDAILLKRERDIFDVHAFVLLPASFNERNSWPARPWSVVVHVLQTERGDETMKRTRELEWTRVAYWGCYRWHRNISAAHFCVYCSWLNEDHCHSSRVLWYEQPKWSSERWEWEISSFNLLTSISVHMKTEEFASRF